MRLKAREAIMRVTAHIKDTLKEEIIKLAANEHKSVSLLVSESLEFYIQEKKRRELGNKVLALAGKVKVEALALKCLDKGRSDYDRS